MKSSPKDHRTRVTRMLIRGAFCSLLNKKPIQNISVRELCEEAGINRGTFYNHYKDIYDLLKRLEDEMFDELEQALSPLLESMDTSANPFRLTTSIFQFLKENSDLCTVTLGPNGDKEFAARLIGLGREEMMRVYGALYSEVTPQQLEYYYAYVSYGCIGLLTKWLDDGLTSSAEEIAGLAEGIMLSGIGFLRKGKK